MDGQISVCAGSIILAEREMPRECPGNLRFFHHPSSSQNNDAMRCEDTHTHTHIHIHIHTDRFVGGSLHLCVCLFVFVLVLVLVAGERESDLLTDYRFDQNDDRTINNQTAD